MISKIKTGIIKTARLCKKHKNKIFIILAVSVAVFGYYNMTNPTEINKYMASVINKGAPANSYFDDDVFYNLVIDSYNIENGASLPYTHSLTDDELKEITKINGGYNKVTSIKGIYKIVNLTELELHSEGGLTSIDLSENVLLNSLNIIGFNAKNIDLTNNIQLKELMLSGINLATLDLSNNVNLESLGIWSSNLSALDLSKNTNLEGLSVGSNDNLAAIDLNKNTNLKSLYFSSNNNFATIDLSKNTNLESLSMHESKIISLDLSKNINLKSVDFSSNDALTSLDLSNSSLLSDIIIDHNDKLSNINLNNLKELTKLELNHNSLKSIDLTGCENLTYLEASYNELEEINISDCVNLQDLEAIYNKLKTIDLSNNALLVRAHLEYNDLLSTNVSNNTKLKILSVDDNNISEINLTNNIELYNLSIEKNNLSNIDLSNNTKLSYLHINDNNLTEIDLSKNVNLEYLNISNNNLTEIDLSNNPKVEWANVDNNGVRIIKALKENLKAVGNAYSLNEIIIDTDKKITPQQDVKLNSRDVVFGSSTKISEVESKLGLTNLQYKVYDYDKNEVTTGNLNEKYKLKLFDGEYEILSLTVHINPANEAFEDYNFYDLLIDTYNEENNTNLSYAHKLTDEELLKITKIDSYYYDYNITSTKGIEKLTNLETLYMKNLKKLTSIDLSKNTLLKKLNLTGSGIKNFDFTNNILLETLILEENTIENINLSKNAKLEELFLFSSNIDSVDLTNNLELKKLQIARTNIAEINLSNNTKLEYLIADRTNLQNLDLSNNLLLKGLQADENIVSGLDLSNYANLQFLYYMPDDFSLEITYNLFDGSCKYSTSNALKLHENFYDDKKFEVYSYDKEIVSVENGKLKGLKEGTTKFYSSVYNTTEYENGIVFSYYIPVTFTVINKGYDLKLDPNGANGEEKVVQVTKDFTIPKNTFTKEGHTFKEWNTKADGTGASYKDEASITLTDNTTLYAIWEKKEFSITFDSNAGIGEMKGQSAKYEENVKLSKNTFTKEGYNFKEWNTKADGTGTSYKDESSVTLTDNITLYAIWEKKEFSIIFDSNTGTGEMENQSAKYEENVKLSKNTFTKEGYNFKEWNTKADGAGTSYKDESNITLTDNITLYAIWKKKEFNITFDSNTGTGEMKNQAVKYKEVNKLSKNAFAKEGYNFKEWNTKADGTGTSYKDEASISLVDNITLYAIWEKKEFSITFDLNTGVGEMENQSAKYEENVKLSKNTFTKEGYNFKEWNTKADGTGTSYKDEASITLTDNITLYAIWQKKEFNITFDSNTGTGEMKSQVVKYKEDTKLTKNTFTKEGYNFKEWNTKTDGAGTSYKNEANVSLTSNITLYAIWSPISYTVKFDSNGGTGKMDGMKFTYDTSSKLNKNVFEKDGYEFKEWNTKADGVGTSYKDEEEVKNLTNKENEEVTLYAIWEFDGVNIKDYEKDNGELSNIKPSTTLTEYKEKVEATGTYKLKVFSANNKELSNDDLICTGCVTKIYKDDAVVEEYTNVVKGDIDGDGEATTADAYDIVLYSIGKKELKSIYFKAGLIDSDEEVTTADAYDIVLYSLGKKGNL